MSRRTGTIVTVLGIALFAAWVWSGLGAYTRVSCDVCIAFEGRRACRTALGATEAEAATAGQRTACAVLAHGVTQAFACDRIAPASVECEVR